MQIEQLLSGLTDRFCLEQFERYLKDPSAFQERVQFLIDAEAPPLKTFLFGLSEHLGMEAVAGVTTVLELLLRWEEVTSNHTRN